MRSTLTIVVVMIALCANLPISAFAETLDIVKAQAEMHDRVSDAAQSYASVIGISSYYTYCLIEMNMHTRQPIDGLVPFGVNYNNIQSQQKLGSGLID